MGRVASNVGSTIRGSTPSRPGHFFRQCVLPAVGAALILFLCAARSLVPTHFAVDTPAGLAATAAHLAYSLLFFAVFAASAISLGGDVVRRVARDPSDKLTTLESCLLSFGVGTWLFSLMSMTLGWLGVLRPQYLQFSFAAVALLAAVITARHGPPSPETWLRLARRAWKSSRVPFVLIALFLFFHGTICLLPSLDWDSAGYQLPLANSMLDVGDFRVWEDAPPFNFPAFSQTLYVYFVAFECDAGVRLLNLAFALFCVLGTYALGLRVGDRRLATTAAALLFSCTILWEVGTTARVDSTVAFFCVASMLCLLLFIDSRSKSIGCLFLVFAGAACGVKLTGLFFVGLPVFYFGWQARKWRWTWQVAGLLLFLIPSGFWYARNYVALEAAFYPITVSAGGLGKSVPMLETPDGKQPVFSVIDSQIQATNFVASSALLQEPLSRETYQRVFPEQRRKIELQKLYYLPSLVLDQSKFVRKPFAFFNPMLLIALLLPWKWWGNRHLRLMMIFAGLFVVVVVAKLTMLRYLIPVFPFLALATAWVFTSYRRKDERSARLPAPLSALILLCVAFPLLLVGVKWFSLSPWKYLAGAQSKVEVLADHGYNYDNPAYAEVIAYLNRHADCDKRTLLVGESKGYLLKHSYQGDYEQLGRYATSWLKFVARSDGDQGRCLSLLEADRFSYVVVNWHYFRWVLHKEPPPQPARLEYALFDLLRFCEQHGEICFDNDSYWIVKLNSPVTQTKRVRATIGRIRKTDSLSH